MPLTANGAATAHSTLGADLHAAPEVHSAIDTLVAEVAARSARLTGARPPRAELKETYESFMKRAADVRGRALLYPYLGSGLGNGALVELMDGSVKWDMISGIGVHFFGHSDPENIRHSLAGALSDTVMEGNLQANFDHYQFGETLLSLAKRNSRLAHCYVSTSGAMANENAVKVCYQKHAPASRVIAFKDCFMGRSVTMSQIGDAAANRVGVPLSTQVDYMPFYDLVAAQRMGKKRYIDMAVWHLMQYIERYPKQHACFIFELIQGEGGFNVGDREWAEELMKCCKAHSIAVWDDEIQTFGRTEQMFAYEMFDLGQYVDVFCVGKMTQICATLFTPEYNPGPGLLSGTFTGGPALFATGTRVLERLRDGNFYGPDGAFARHHALFRQHAKALAAKHPEWFPPVTGPFGPAVDDIVGGVGGMMRFTPFGGNKDKINKACKTMFEEGVVAFYCGHGPFHLRMLPPLPVFKESDWPAVFQCIERGLARAAQ
ncbi:MAG: aminotransferase class III-fold pyridoxal phosphate-dependent enzyme [bacterium]